MQIFINPKENRLRFVWRIVSFIMINLCIGILLALFGEWLDAGTRLTLILRGLGVIISILITALYIDKRKLRSLGIVWNREFVKETGLGMAAAGVPFSILFGLAWAAGWIEIIQLGFEKSSFWIPFALYLIQMVIVAAWEELAFRGYFIVNITEAIKSRYINRQQAFIISVLGTSALFAVGHLNNPGATWTSILNIFGAGVVLAVPFLITGRLAVSIGAHWGWNFFQGGLYGFPVSGMVFSSPLINTRETGPDAWTGGSFGPEAGYLGIIGLMIMLMLFGIYFWYKKYNMDVQISLHEST